LFLKSPARLILASGSAYRAELLARLRVPFTTERPDADETPRPGESPSVLATRLAHTKARLVAERSPEAWVIGSDQVAVLPDDRGHGRLLGKPGTASACAAQLRDCAGRSVAFLTAVAVLRHADAAAFEFLDTTRVQFRKLDAATIERYVAAESPLDCAGGFKCEGLGISLLESIHGTDPTALIGLPLIRLAAVLRDVGFEVP
jgi:septum formation protein